MNAVSFADIGQRIAYFFTQGFDWTVIPGTLLACALIYFVCKLLYSNNAKYLIFVYLGVMLVGGIIAIFSPSEYAALALLVLFLLLSMFFLLLYSVEIKRSIWRRVKTGTAVAKKTVAGSSTRTSLRADECITAIVKAVQNLSKSDTGALIVLSNGNLPQEILESGVALDATVSSQLIEGIFVPKAPLHDGALIILGDRIQAAGCFLPLSQRDLPKDYGTRHRAGIGVTESADVMTIIVSEETGIVSTVRRGVITRYVDSDKLKKFLREYYWHDVSRETPRP